MRGDVYKCLWASRGMMIEEMGVGWINLKVHQRLRLVNNGWIYFLQKNKELMNDIITNCKLKNGKQNILFNQFHIETSL